MKKNRLIKLLILLLAIVMCITACSGDTTPPANTPDPGSSQNEPSTSGGTEDTDGTESSDGTQPAVRPAVTDALQGKTINFWSGVGEPGRNTIEYQSWKDVEERYGVTINFERVSYNIAVTRNLGAALSGISECEIWVASWYDVFPAFIGRQMALPLSDYYDFDNDPNWKDLPGAENQKWGDVRYALSNGVEGPAWGLWYNKELLRRENLEDPAELVKQGRWDWDTFLDMCRKLTKTEGGQTTQWGYYDEYLFVNAILTNGGHIVDASDPDNPVFDISSDAARNAMNWALSLINTYRVVPNEGAIGDPVLNAMFYEGKVAFFTYQANYGPSLCVPGGMRAADLGYTYFPKGPDADDFAIHAPSLGPVHIIPPQTEHDKTALVQLLQDYLCVWDKTKPFAVDYSELMEIAYSDALWDTIFENNEEFLMTGAAKNKPSYIISFNLGDILNMHLFNPLSAGNIDLQTGISAVTPRAQAQIDQLIRDASENR